MLRQLPIQSFYKFKIQKIIAFLGNYTRKFGSRKHLGIYFYNSLFSRIEMKMLDIQERKKNLISGAFRQTEGERRQQRLRDIRDLFGITDQPANN